MEILKKENLKLILIRILEFFDDKYTIILGIILFLEVLPTYLSSAGIGAKIVV